MGQISFLVRDERLTTARAMSSIHMMAFDGTLWPCRTRLDSAREAGIGEDGPHVLVVERNSNQSARLFVLYPTPQFGEICVGTATLLEREQPYDLTTELARGTLCRLRNLLSNWREGGLVLPDAIQQRTVAAQARLARAIFEPNSGEAGAALELAIALLFEVCGEFNQQVAQFRRDTENPRDILLGLSGADGTPAGELQEFLNCHIRPAGLAAEFSGDDAPGLDSAEWVKLAASSVAGAPEAGASAASASEAGASVAAADTSSEKADGGKQPFCLIGPLLDANPGGLPKWICQMQHIEQRRQAVLDVARQTLVGLQGQPCDLLHAVSGINGVGHRYMTFSQQLHLAIDLIQVVENLLPTAPILASFDQPWGERLAWSVGGGHALQIADTLLRQGCRIDCLGLEINLDYWPIGSLPRDPSQWVDLLDFWSHFGVPLLIFLRLPIGSALPGEGPAGASRGGEAALPKDQQVIHSLGSTEQIAYLRAILPLLLGRPNIRGVIWNQNQGRGMFKGCRLVAPEGQPLKTEMVEILKTWQI